MPQTAVSRRFFVLAMPAVLAPTKSFAAATGGGFSSSELVSKGTGPPTVKDLGATSCAKCPPTEDELQRLALGYKRLKYLLDNWEAETTVCIRGCTGKPENCGCIRDPLVVQSYMGFKSMKDPLFKIDQAQALCD